MQDVENYDVNVVVWNCGEECAICNVLCDCCVMSDVENDAMCCDVRCGVMRCGMLFEICCDIGCGCGVE